LLSLKNQSGPGEAGDLCLVDQAAPNESKEGLLSSRLAEGDERDASGVYARKKPHQLRQVVDGTGVEERGPRGLHRERQRSTRDLPLDDDRIV
jgi:hypothetical protein